MVRAISRLLLTSLLTVTISFCSNTTLLPCINSKLEPCGMGIFFIKLILSVLVLDIPTVALIPEPDIFASVIPMITVAVTGAVAVYIPTVVTPTLAFVLSLKLFR